MAAVDSVSPWSDTFPPDPTLPSPAQAGGFFQAMSPSQIEPAEPLPSSTQTSPNINQQTFVRRADCELNGLSALKAGTGVMCWDDKRCPIPPENRNAARCQPSRSMSSTDVSTARRRSGGDDSAASSQPPMKLKRTSSDPEDGETDECPPDSTAQVRKSIETSNKSRRQMGRVPHNLIERRYRDNLNSQIEALRLVVPSLKDACDCAYPDVEESGVATVAPAKLPSKAVIISTAVDYVKQLEQEKAKLTTATKVLQEQVAGLQKLVRCDDCAILQYLASLQLDSAQPAM
jgi:hypothetical protein